MFEMIMTQVSGTDAERAKQVKDLEAAMSPYIKSIKLYTKGKLSVGFDTLRGMST
jgi:hypothetical protein